MNNTPKLESLKSCIIQLYLDELLHKQRQQSAVLQQPVWEAQRWWFVAGPLASPVFSPFYLWRSLFWVFLLAASSSSSGLLFAEMGERRELNSTKKSKAFWNKGLKNSFSFKWLAVQETAREGKKTNSFEQDLHIFQLLKPFAAPLGRSFIQLAPVSMQLLSRKRNHSTLAQLINNTFL